METFIENTFHTTKPMAQSVCVFKVCQWFLQQWWKVALCNRNRNCDLPLQLQQKIKLCSFAEKCVECLTIVAVEQQMLKCDFFGSCCNSFSSLVELVVKMSCARAISGGVALTVSVVVASALKTTPFIGPERIHHTNWWA